jgi:hypothetical protein
MQGNDDEDEIEGHNEGDDEHYQATRDHGKAGKKHDVSEIVDVHRI